MASLPDDVDRVYRIVSRKYPPFDGYGAFRWGSRWISPGRYVVHTAESYALAVLENLVHWQTATVPAGLICVHADIPDGIEQEELDRQDLPRNVDYESCREIGDEWYDRGDTAVLWVPSVVSPVERNVLINQVHEDFNTLRIGKPFEAQVDVRLIAGTRD